MFSHKGLSFRLLAAALFLAATGLATEVYVYPAHALYSTGRVMESNGTYHKHNHEVMYGKDAPDSKWQGFFRFDLSGLSESLSVESAVLEYRAASVSNPPPHSVITHLTVDPWSATGASLWQAITGGEVVAPDMAHGRGRIERPLNAAGLAAVQAGIAQGWVALGVHKWDTSNTWGHILGFPSGPNSPRLRLNLAVRDIGVVRIVAPQGVYLHTDTIAPTVVVENHGEVDAPFRATFTISTGSVELYRRSLDVAGLAPGTEMSLVLPDWVPDKAGVERVGQVSLEMAGDFDSDNNMMAAWFSIAPVRSDPPDPPNPPDPPGPPHNEVAWGWREVNPMPMMLSRRPVRLGGWLASDPKTGRIYAGKGNRTGDFASYEPLTGRWQELAPVPAGDFGLAPGKGARGVADGRGSVYMVKGNRSLEFWRYDIAANSWERLPDLPLGPNSGPVRSGSGMVHVEQWGTRYVYLLKGPKGDLVRYNTSLREWEMLASAPPGLFNKWDRGSWLVTDGAQKLYAHKARKHELWTFDLESERWDESSRRAMPLIGAHGRSLKLREGGAATWRNGSIYALKGGKSQEYWRYAPELDRWSELETIPKYGSSLKLARVGAGSGFANYPYGNAVFALKGGKSLEFWRYTFAPPGYGPQGAQAAPAAAPLRFGFAANPVRSGQAVLNYSLSRPGPASITVYDAAGRVRSNLRAQFARSGSQRIDLGELAAGVYLVRVEAENASASQKLVIAR